MKKSENKVKDMNTEANRIINEMSKNVDSVEYIWAEVKFNSVDYSNIDIVCGSDRFYWNEKTNSEHKVHRRSDKTHLFVCFFTANCAEGILVDMRTGEGYYKKRGTEIALRLGDLDAEGYKVLLPIYKSLYLDKYADLFAEAGWIEKVSNTGNEDVKFLGIRDWFSVKANELGVLPWECQGVVREVK